MAIHNLGYRQWHGRTAPRYERWLVIAKTGVRLAWQSRWLRRLLLLAWLPAVWFGTGFFLWEQYLIDPEIQEVLTPFLSNMAPSSDLGDALDLLDAENPQQARHDVWAWLLQTFFRYSQSVIMALVVGVVAPTLISQDVRSRAFMLYFSRPITRAEYILGKLSTVWLYLAIITVFPALCLYVLGVLLSPDFSVVEATWDLPWRIVLASAVLMIPTALLALCLSALTQESRYASFAWFAIWILGWFAYGVMTTADVLRQSERDRGPVVRSMDRLFPAGEDQELPRPREWSHLSLYHTLGRVQSWVFGQKSFADVRTSVVILGVLSCVAGTILFRRVAAPMRA